MLINLPAACRRENQRQPSSGLGRLKHGFTSTSKNETKLSLKENIIKI
jgi:hypothetical protein